VKSWPSEHCLEANKWAIQILGGYGYARDYPVERLYRDNRLNHIHEGTFGIQGLDLLGRKVLGDGGETLFSFIELMQDAAADAAQFVALGEDVRIFLDSVGALFEATRALKKCGNPPRRLANATIYLDAFGHVVIGWIWLRQAIVAAQTLAEAGLPDAERAFYESKLRTCRYFLRHEMPLAQARFALCGSLDSTCLDAPVEMFGGLE
jgi:butyryl-CoA dehydrogenase